MEVSQVTLLTRLLALVDNIRDKNQIKEGEGRVNNVNSVESSVTEVALCVRPSVSIICRIRFSAHPLASVLLSLCPCGRQLLQGLLPGRQRPEALRGLPHLCVGKIARRLL